MKKRTLFALYIGVVFAFVMAGTLSFLDVRGDESPISASIHTLSQDSDTMVESVMENLNPS